MPPIHATYPSDATQDTVEIRSRLATGLSPSMALHSSRLCLGKLGCKDSPQHYISRTLLHGIQFALYCFRSLLLTASHLISFPPGTKMFQFPGFPILSDSK
jgi:hypothetical protein